MSNPLIIHTLVNPFKECTISFCDRDGDDAWAIIAVQVAYACYQARCIRADHCYDKAWQLELFDAVPKRNII